MMRWGLMGARADRRGLATQTQEFARHLQPDRILGVDLTAGGDSPYPCDWTPFDGHNLTVVTPDRLTRKLVKRWASDLDVVVAHETFYVDEAPDWIRAAGCRSLLVANPEFYRHRLEDIPRPDRVVTPTRWLHDRMEDADVLPIPVDRSRCRHRPRPLADDGEPLTFLHVAGHRAAYDRDGLVTVMQAAKLVRKKCRLLVRSQQKITLPSVPNSNVDVKLVVDDVDDYWRLYQQGDVMVYPRRYGGQCLPLLEASSCGLPTVMTDVAPQSAWLPEPLLVSVQGRRTFETQNGPVTVHNGLPAQVAAAMDRLSSDRGLVAEMSGRVSGWVAGRSWENLGGVWRRLIGDVAGA